MKPSAFAPHRTNFDALFAILSQISGRPKDDLVDEFGDIVIQKARDPKFLFSEIPQRRYNRYLKAGKLKQAAIMTQMLEDPANEDSTHFWMSRI